jgi:heme/copper-type cytochrome/quinol oxidase subunit 2
MHYTINRTVLVVIARQSVWEEEKGKRDLILYVIIITIITIIILIKWYFISGIFFKKSHNLTKYCFKPEREHMRPGYFKLLI